VFRANPSADIVIESNLLVGYELGSADKPADAHNLRDTGAIETSKDLTATPISVCTSDCTKLDDLARIVAARADSSGDAGPDWVMSGDLN
jgi:hypothetical protein